MAIYKPQVITLSRRKILFTTLVGVGALTFCYVLGVHVGRQSAALNSINTRGVGENLDKLPAAIQYQIKALDDAQDSKDVAEVQKSVQQTVVADDVSKVSTEKKEVTPAKASIATLSKPEMRGAEKKTEEATRWTTQLISTPDFSEAQRMVGKIQAAGFSAVVISEKGLFKVRLSKVGSREMVDGIMTKLKNRGFKPFAIRVG